MHKKAVVLLSGGLDSATCLAIAIERGFECYGLSFDYGQRHSTEIEFARGLARDWDLKDHLILNIDLGRMGGSALTDMNLEVPLDIRSEGIPSTYVPARNTIFLSYALAYAEVLSADCIFIGVNAVDYSGYPDCRPEYIEAFQKMAKLATKEGVEGKAVRIETPLIHLRKTEIVQKGLALGVDYSRTVSCYQADSQGRSCGRCESCLIRKSAFEVLNMHDPTVYVGNI